MEWWLLSFFLGAILSLFLPIVPALFYVNLFLLIAVTVLCLKKWRRYSGLFFGAAWLLFNGLQYDALWQDNAIDKSRIHQKAHLVRGQVASLPSHKQGTSRFNLIIEQLDKEPMKKPITVRLAWRQATIRPKQGQYLRLKVKIKPAHGFANPGTFSYQTWLRQKQIIATGYVLKSESNQVLNGQVSLRQQLVDRLSLLLPDSHVSSMALALAFGERNQITPQQWLVLKATGTQHLIAVSGLHLGLIAGFTFTFAIFLMRGLVCLGLFQAQSVTWLVGINGKIIALMLSCLMALFYAYLAGFALPTIRALIMLLLYCGARCLGLRLGLSRWLLLAVFLIILFVPFSLISLSFWLSLYAVSLIFLLLWRFSSFLSTGSKSLRFIKSLLLIQLGLSLFMLPLVAVFNLQLPLVSLPANILAVPWMSFTAIPLCLLSVLALPISESLSLVLLELAVGSLELIWYWLKYLTEISWAAINISSLQLLVLSCVVSLLLVGLIGANVKRVLVPLTGACLVLIASLYQETRADKDWQANLMDVGHGLAVVIERHGKAILYDTGASYPSGFNIAEAVILPYLQYQGIAALDKLIVSHGDNDHAGGLTKLTDNMPVETLLGNGLSPLESLGCRQGDRLTWQDLTIRVLWPPKAAVEEGQGKRQRNDDSCVIQISDGVNRLLLTGDISHKVEGVLQQQAGIKSHVLIAPHHGSKTSSSRDFIAAVAPSLALFSTGYLNRWKMPNTDVLKRYQDAHINTLNTAETGMVRVRFGLDNIRVERYRFDIWPFWFAN